MGYDEDLWGWHQTHDLWAREVASGRCPVADHSMWSKLGSVETRAERYRRDTGKRATVEQIRGWIDEADPFVPPVDYRAETAPAERRGRRRTR